MMSTGVFLQLALLFAIPFVSIRPVLSFTHPFDFGNTLAIPPPWPPVDLSPRNAGSSSLLRDFPNTDKGIRGGASSKKYLKGNRRGLSVAQRRPENPRKVKLSRKQQEVCERLRSKNGLNSSLWKYSEQREIIPKCPPLKAGDPIRQCPISDSKLQSPLCP